MAIQRAPALSRNDWQSTLAVLRSSRLAWAIVISISLHVLVLALRFAPPQPIRFAPNDSPLEVILLNAATNTAPLKPDVLAQASMEGGGDHDKGRAKSPLPAETRIEDGDALQRQRARVEELEARQRQLLAQARSETALQLENRRNAPAPAAEPANDPAETEQVMARLQAEIAQRIEDYNKRPKRLTYGINAVGVNFARYVDDWANKVERIGTERYPVEARGKQYDTLIVLVEIDKFGNVVDIAIKKKSKYEALNRAARAIVLAGQPYERFPPEMAREGDILQIVRTWYFTNDSVQTRAAK